MLKKVKALLTGAVALVASTLIAVSASPTAASAAGATAYNQRNQYLTAVPNTTNRSCVSRRILLAADTYVRTLYLYDEESSYGDSIQGAMTLGAGWYLWEDCLQGTNHYSYTHTDTLNPDNPNWATSTWTFEYRVYQAGPVDGIFASWGGSLTPF
jgi:hypothetical protein